MVRSRLSFRGLIEATALVLSLLFILIAVPLTVLPAIA